MVTGITASGSGIGQIFFLIISVILLLTVNTGGVIFPQMFKLIDRFGFAKGIRILVAVIAVFLVIACGLGIPKPSQKHASLGPIMKASTWISTKAMKNVPYMLYTASMWLAFAGYYPVAYHLAEWADERREPGSFEGYWFIAILNG